MDHELTGSPRTTEISNSLHVIYDRRNIVFTQPFIFPPLSLQTHRHLFREPWIPVWERQPRAFWSFPGSACGMPVLRKMAYLFF